MSNGFNRDKMTKEELLREQQMELLPSEKVAVLMVAMGEEGTAEVMRHLADFEIEQITQIISEVGNVPTSLQDQVLEEFEQHLLAGEYMAQGGTEFARGALERAVGPRRAQEILDRIMSTDGKGFHMLKKVPADQIAPFITNEHPQTIALILSQLDARQGAGILGLLPQSLQSEVAYRVATMENITPSSLKQIEENLEVNLRDILSGHTDVGGPKIVADMLNLTGGSVEKHVLREMDNQNPEIAETVRNMMFVFDDFDMLTDQEIQTVVREVEQKDLVIALKGTSVDVREKILSNISERVRNFIEDEIEFIGPIRLSEVEQVQLRIVQKVRQLEEQGLVNITRGASQDTLV